MGMSDFVMLIVKGKANSRPFGAEYEYREREDTPYEFTNNKATYRRPTGVVVTYLYLSANQIVNFHAIEGLAISDYVIERAAVESLKSDEVRELLRQLNMARARAVNSREVSND